MAKNPVSPHCLSERAAASTAYQRFLAASRLHGESSGLKALDSTQPHKRHTQLPQQALVRVGAHWGVRGGMPLKHISPLNLDIQKPPGYSRTHGVEQYQ